MENGSKVVWSNKTVKWTYKYQIFAVDGGTPKRGDSVPLTITFDVSCESTGAIVADAHSGDVFFRAPGLTGSIYRTHTQINVKFQKCLINAQINFCNKLLTFSFSSFSSVLQNHVQCLA